MSAVSEGKHHQFCSAVPLTFGLARVLRNLQSPHFLRLLSAMHIKPRKFATSIPATMTRNVCQMIRPTNVQSPPVHYVVLSCVVEVASIFTLMPDESTLTQHLHAFLLDLRQRLCLTHGGKKESQLESLMYRGQFFRCDHDGRDNTSKLEARIHHRQPMHRLRWKYTFHRKDQLKELSFVLPRKDKFNYCGNMCCMIPGAGNSTKGSAVWCSPLRQFLPESEDLLLILVANCTDFCGSTLTTSIMCAMLSFFLRRD